VELSANGLSISLVQRPITEWQADPWVLMRPRCTIYQPVAGVNPNNYPQSDPELVKQLWWNLPSSSSTFTKTSFRRVGGFMSLDATEKYLIPLGS